MSFYGDRKVLVTGGTGTIGIPLVRRLVDLGARVTVASLDTPERANVLFGGRVQFEQADLLRYETCERVTRGQELMFNLVGIKGSVGIGLTKAASYFVPMILFNTYSMEAAFRNGVERFLFVSSICAYPPLDLREEERLWDGLPKQNDKYAGVAKRVGEVQGETYLHEYGWDAVRIVRPSNVYGPYDDFEPETAQVIPALIRRMLDGEHPMKVWGDGTAIRDFIYSEDVVEGMLLALEKAPPCVPVNLGSGHGVSIKDVAETIASLLPEPPAIEWDASKPAGDPVRLLSVGRAKDLLNFEAATSFRDGIQKTIDWYRENREFAKQREGGLRA